jgi:hypothetical protein
VQSAPSISSRGRITEGQGFSVFCIITSDGGNSASSIPGNGRPFDIAAAMAKVKNDFPLPPSPMTSTAVPLGRNGGQVHNIGWISISDAVVVSTSIASFSPMLSL